VRLTRAPFCFCHNRLAAEIGADYSGHRPNCNAGLDGRFWPDSAQNGRSCRPAGGSL